MPNLSQYQIAPPPTKTEYEAKVGSTAMGTTATTLTGAIKEVNDKINVLTKHSLGTNITLSTSNYTTTSDGYFTITIAPGLARNVYGYINDTLALSIRGQSGDTGYPTTGIFVKKGMKIRLSEAVMNESGGLFYPLV